MMKKFICLILIVSAMLSFATINVFADESSTSSDICAEPVKFYKEFKPSKTELVYNEISIMENGNICAGTTVSNTGIKPENVLIAIVCYGGNNNDTITKISTKKYKVLQGETLSVKTGCINLVGDEVVRAFVFGENLAPLEKSVCLPENPQRILTLQTLENFDKTLYSEELLLWLANLYDPESGGFYFKTNAKYTEGFLPDKESTAKQIGTVAKMLGCSSNDIVNEFTPEMKEKLLSFARKYQSDEDGYWYEEPWGRYISENKKLYQTSAAIQLVKMVGGTPLYLTPEQRLKQEQTANLSGTDEVSLLSEDSRYNSKEDFKAWFDSLSWDTSLYSAGSLMLSNMGNIIAAGYFDYALELITERIDPETGLLGKLNTATGKFDTHEISQDAMSGTYKIISYWGQAYSFYPAYPYYPGVDNLIYSVVEVIMNDSLEYTNACHVSNAISILGHPCIQFAKKESLDYLKSMMPDVINMTVQKAMRHKTPDGSYTYSPNLGSGGNQGSIHAYCIADGETSGSSMMLALRQNMYNMVGVTMPPLFDGKYSASDFVEMMKKVEPTKKIEYKTDVLYSFDDIIPGDLPQNDGFRSSGDITISQNEGVSGSNAVRIHSPGNGRPAMLFDVGTKNGKGFVCEFDLKITSPTVCLQFEFGSYFNALVMLLTESGGRFKIGNKTVTDWTQYKKIKVEYTVANGVGTSKYYLDNQLVYTGAHYSNNYPDMPAIDNIPALQIRAGNDKPFTVYIDNFEFHENK